jgi:hypothetical protein
MINIFGFMSAVMSGGSDDDRCYSWKMSKLYNTNLSFIIIYLFVEIHLNK